MGNVACTAAVASLLKWSTIDRKQIFRSLHWIGAICFGSVESATKPKEIALKRPPPQSTRLQRMCGTTSSSISSETSLQGGTQQLMTLIPGRSERLNFAIWIDKLCRSAGKIG